MSKFEIAAEWPERHKHLWRSCKTLPQDYQPYGGVDRGFGSDCSCGCRFFYSLYDGEWGGPDADWGVCTNPASHRCGLLTFEHQGCAQFEPSEDDDD